MPAFENLPDDSGHRLDVGGRPDLHIHRVDLLDGRKVAEDGNGDEHRLARQFRLTETLHTFLESASHRKLQTQNLDHLANRGGVRAVKAPRQGFGEHRHFLAQLDVAGVQ